jgi:hypothetical protein
LSSFSLRDIRFAVTDHRQVWARSVGSGRVDEVRQRSVHEHASEWNPRLDAVMIVEPVVPMLGSEWPSSTTRFASFDIDIDNKRYREARDG